MPQISRTALVPYSAEQMYQLVNDVQSYPLSGSGLLVSADVVRHGADGQGFRAKLCSDAVDTSRFHFHAEDAVFFHHVEHFAVRRVEQVSGEQVTHASINTQCFSRVYRVTHHVKVSDSGKVMVFKTI